MCTAHRMRATERVRSSAGRDMTTIDAYSHAGLPRFQTVADYAKVMKSAGIDRAVLSAFGSSPDLGRLHEALLAQPDVYRLVGIPIGRDRKEMEAAVRAQLAAGFSALRIDDEDVIERAWLLGVIGCQRARAFVCGGVISTDEGAQVLLKHLEQHRDALVVGGHFASPRNPSVLDSGAVAELFRHPRFFVVCSRHGAFEPRVIEPWAAALAERVGWDRLMWGAESPVLYWRNETMESAMAWVDRLSPTEAESAAFFGGNAERVFFGDDIAPGALELPFDPWETALAQPAQMWLNSLRIDQALAGRLVRGWLAESGPHSEPLGSYVERILDQALPPAGEPMPISRDLSSRWC